MIALVISIIIMLILAGVSINAIVGEDGILTKAKEASIISRFAAYEEATQMALDSYLISVGNSLKKYIPNITDEDLKKFAIVNGTLLYLGNDEEEKEVAKRLGIEINFGENITIEDLQVIQDKIIPICSSLEIPSNDTISTPSGLIGQRLYDKNSLNTDRWRIIIDYNGLNQEKARYGSGYYFLNSGSYDINGETINLYGNYVVNYGENLLYGLSNNYVEWSLSSTLANIEGLVLNIDPTNLADGNWAGIEKHGDVVYNAESKSLLFNESEDNEKGEGGYIALTRNGVDFSSGFTFEFFANLTRGRYNPDGYRYTALPFFCRTSDMNSNVWNKIMFGFDNNKCICKFYDCIEDTSSNENGLYTNTSGGIFLSDKLNTGYSLNEDFYLTFVYIVYDENQEKEEYDDYMKNNKIDKIEYYINGELYAFTYHDSNAYKNGLNCWNNDDSVFYVGICPWWGKNTRYYLQGKVYTTRLYTTPMTAEQVADNRDMTMKYRASF